MPPAPANLATRILEQLQGPARARDYGFRRGGEDQRVPGAALAEQIAAHAAGLAELGFPPGTVVPILAPSSPELWAAFVGAMAADLVPCVLAAPTVKSHMETYLRNLGALLDRYGHRRVVAAEAYAALLAQGAQGARGGDDAPEVLALEGLPKPSAAAPTPRRGGPAVAFLQHSSGSTGVPKGVALTHDQVLGHLQAYAGTLGLSPGSDRVCSWLPLYHDMGLLTSFLLPLTCGLGCFTMTPEDWILDPGEILRIAAREGSTLAWWPNFAFSLLAERGLPADCGDLSRLRWLVNCSEPVLPGSVEAFAAAAAPFGLAPTALHTCYAMAENVFAVTQSGPAAPRVLTLEEPSLEVGGAIRPAPPGAPTATRVMASGRAMDTVEVRVVDSARRPVPEGVVGEVSLRGPSRFARYLELPALTDSALEDGWYHTGDSGFLEGGELFVLGRLGDLVIVRGRKYFPNFIEEVVHQLEGVKKGRVVAFGVRSEAKGTEELAVLAESEGAADKAVVQRLKREIRRDVLQRVDCVVDHVRILPLGTLVKTSSGKIARRDNQLRFLRQLGRA